MSRLPMLPRDPKNAELKAMFDEVRKHGVEVPNLYRVMGHAPAMLRAWLDMAWPLRLNAKTPRGLRELVILRGAQLGSADYEWVHHVQMALAAGVPQAKIDALDDWRASKFYDKPERAALRMADEVTQGPGASAECMVELARHFNAAEQLELLLTASFYVCVSRFVISLDVELEDEMRR
jgi:alkylhydroperoxidase family enzyme